MAGQCSSLSWTGRSRLPAPRFAILDLESGAQKALISGVSQGRYVASGHLVFGFSGTLRAVPFDLDTLAVRGNAVPVVERVVTKGTGAANFAMSSDGLLVYASGESVGDSDRGLVWVDRQGREEASPAPRHLCEPPDIAGRHAIAFDVRDQENDIWLWDFTRQSLTRRTFDQGLNLGPTWTPDGMKLVFSSSRAGPESLFWQAADGTGAAERLTTGKVGRPQIPYSVTPDGARMVFGEAQTAAVDPDQLELGAERKVTPLLNAAHNEHNGEASPDGRWLAYQSNESGTDEVYVRPFPNVGDGRWQIPTGGGTRPAWARSGREVFYLKADGTLVAVPVERGGGSLAARVPKMLFRGPYFRVLDGRTYDVAADGRRFLMIKEDAPRADRRPTQLVVVQNFFEELKRLVPTP